MEAVKYSTAVLLKRLRKKLASHLLMQICFGGESMWSMVDSELQGIKNHRTIEYVQQVAGIYIS